MSVMSITVPTIMNYFKEQKTPFFGKDMRIIVDKNQTPFSVIQAQRKQENQGGNRNPWQNQSQGNNLHFYQSNKRVKTEP